MVTKKMRSVEAFINRMKRGQKEVAESEEISVHEFETEPATVVVDHGLTINLGNYESARLSVAIRVPCYAEEVDAAYAWAKDWVESRIREEVDKIRPKEE